MLTLAKLPDPAANAKAIMALETKLAQAQWNKVDARDADKTYNFYQTADLKKLTPDFAWPTYIDAIDAQKTPGLVVGEPSFFTAWDKTMQSTPLPAIGRESCRERECQHV